MTLENQKPIAVIGMACRYPGAGGLIELWENILACRQQFRDLPDVRLPKEDYYNADPKAPDKTYASRLAVLDGFEFDPRNHRIPKSTFECTDIVQWLALATALEAFVHAGLNSQNIPRNRTGVILGNTLTGEETRANTLRLRWPFVRKVFRRTAQAQGISTEHTLAFEACMEQIYKSVFPTSTEDSLAGGLANTIAGRICNYLDLHGGGFIVDGACASSLLSIATAADYLHQNKLDLVLAGGVDVSLDTFELIGFAKATALTYGDMQVYDRNGRGFIPGEGCGMVLLKRLDDARRDGDKVYAVLRGCGISSDGSGGITAPSAQGQSLALIRAYQNAGYPPQSLDFIEGHGTGTAVGDRVELEAIALAIKEFGEAEAHCIGMTSLKSIVGHTKAAAGIGGFIKTVIALNRRIIPPTAACQHPHDCFNGAAQALYPVQDGEIRQPGKPIRAGVSAMGFGGINCHVTLESADAPTTDLAPTIPEQCLLASRQNTELILFDANNPAALLNIIRLAQRNAQGISAAELLDFAAHHASQLQNLPCRAALIVGSIAELSAKLELLQQRLQQTLHKGEIWRHSKIYLSWDADCSKVGFLFPGQGSQQLGMARILTSRFTWAADFSDAVDSTVSALRAKFGYREVPVLSELYLTSRQRDPDNTQATAGMAELTQTENAQPAICTASWLWHERLRSLGITPTATGGHSLGELSAFAAAHLYDAKTLTNIAALRGIAMSSSVGPCGSMAALLADAATVQTMVDNLNNGYCVIANRNSPQQTVVSGDTDAVRHLLDTADRQGIKGIALPVSHAFHSRLVTDAAEILRQSEQIPECPKPAICRVFSGSNGLELPANFNLKEYLAEQILQPVDFSCLLAALSPHCDWFIEVGPGKVLTKLVQDHTLSEVTPCFPVESRAGDYTDFHAIVAEAFVRGTALNWPVLHADRLVRPFIPAWQRKFYVNPCERELTVPFETDNSVEWLKNPGIVARIPVSELTYHPPTITGPISLPQTHSNTLLQRLMLLVAERTGFELDSLSSDQKLLDDLNIDSIKATSLLAEFLTQTHTQDRVAIAGLANASLGEIAAKIQAAGTGSALPDEAQANRVPLAAAPRWIRAFTLSKSQFAVDEQTRAEISLDKNLILIAPGFDSHFAQQLALTLNTDLFQDAPLSGQPCFADLLVILLDDAGTDTLQQHIAQLTVLQRLHQTQPKLWQRLSSIVILQRQQAIQPTLPIGIWSFAASLFQERPDLEVQVISLDQALPTTFIQRVLATELKGTAGFQQIKYDANGHLYKPQLHVTAIEKCTPRNIAWSATDVWLVTGGGKGITAACALAFARETGVKLAIIGSSPLPNSGEHSELAHNLAQFSATGIEYRYYRADISQPAELAKAVADAQQELGLITGILHGAGRNTPRPLHTVSAAEAESEIAAKLGGTENLLTLFQQAPIKLFAVFTSIIGVTGMANNAWYAFANETSARLMETYADTHPNTAVICYAFGIWDEVGMGVKLGSIAYLQQMGIDAIPLQQGIEHFLRWLHLTPPQLEVIITANSPALSARFPAPIDKQPMMGRFIGNIRHLLPGVELISRVELDTRTDLYLLDHDYRGSLLFPTVMGLEAMAQQCLALIEDKSLEIIGIEAIHLDQAITVLPDRPALIEIRALVQERYKLADPLTVTTAIYTEQTGWREAHFSANFLFGKRQAQQSDELAPANLPPLKIRPTTDLYGPVLFQGPLFQRITALSVLNARQVSFITEVRHHTREGFSTELSFPLVLGDPYYRDSLLQASQLSLTPEQCLPRSIRKIEFYATAQPVYAVQHYRAQAIITGRSANSVFGEVLVFDQHDNLIERISGYEVVVLARRPDLPSLQQLLNSADVRSETIAPATALDSSITTPDARKMPQHVDDTAATWPHWLATGGIPQEVFGMKAEFDLVNPSYPLRFRFPLTFKDAAHADGSIYFVRFFEWMGRLREMALHPILERLTHEFTNGGKAWVTNHSWLRILHPVYAGEVLEVGCRFLGRGGPNNAVVSVGFSWYRVANSGQMTLVAISQIQMTWADVIGHGVVSPAPYPAYMAKFFNDLSKAPDAFVFNASQEFAQAYEQLGACLWQDAPGPHCGVLLKQQSFSTSLNDANLVGNIYYAKYYELQGILCDGYFYQLIPETYRPSGNQGGLRCKHTEVLHLRDAMPFDTLHARLFMTALYEKGLALRFEFFRASPEGELEKLASGSQLLQWTSSVTDNTENSAMSLPDSLRNELMRVRSASLVYRG